MESLEEKRIVGREKELLHIRSFLVSRLEQRKGGSLYVCGRSGTGKTEAMRQIYDGLKKSVAASTNNSENRSSKKQKQQTSVEMCWLNGSSAGSSFFSTLAKEFNLVSSSSASRAVSEDALERGFRNQSTLFVLVTDEIDLLPGETVRKLFSWAIDKSNLVLIGIANVVNAYANLFKVQISPPEELPFAPYDSKQLCDIVQVKLGPNKIAKFQPEALELASRKVKSGDVRQLLSVCEKSLAHAGAFTNEEKKVTMIDVVRAVASQSSYSRTIQNLPVQCRFALVACTIAASSAETGKSGDEQSSQQQQAPEYTTSIDEKQIKEAWAKLREWWKIPIEGDVTYHVNSLVDNQLLERLGSSMGSLTGKGKSKTSIISGKQYKILPNREEVLGGLVGEADEEEEQISGIGNQSSSSSSAVVNADMLKRRPIIMAFNGVRPARLIANMHAPMKSS